MRFVTEQVQAAVREAVTTIEKSSSVEVVVSMRARLERWPSAHAAVGTLFAIAMLGFTLFSDIEFPLWEILVFPVLAGMIGGVAVELIPALQRALTPKRVKAHFLHDASRAAFYDLGVHKTRGRTGLLVYVAIREQAAALVGDVAVVDAIGQPALDKLAATIAAAIPQGGVAVATAIARLELSKQLPRAADDVNELADSMHILRPRARGKRVAS
jgi:putative membrane protein